MSNEISKEQRIRRQSLDRFLSFDTEEMVRLLTLDHDENELRIRFIGKDYRVDRKTGELYVDDRLGTLDEMASIYEYLTTAKETPFPLGNWASIAQLCTNTTDTSLGRYVDYLSPFENHMELMSKACEALGGKIADKGDVSYIIPIMEGVNVWFQYWERDDEFPPSVQFLFDGGIIRYFRWSILWNVMTCLCARMKEEVGIEG